MTRASRTSLLILLAALAPEAAAGAPAGAAAAAKGAAAAAASGPGAPRAREIVVYSAIRPGNWDLYEFERSATGAIRSNRLTDDPAPDDDAAFSPDGRWLVFVSEGAGSADLAVLDRDTRGPRRLLTADRGMEDAPAVSPDGRSLAFVSTRDGNADIFTMPFRPSAPPRAGAAAGPGAPDGLAGALNLTRSPGGDFHPAWSPDGRLIAFASNRDHLEYRMTASPPEDYQAADIYVMRADGSAPRRLTTDPGWEGSPAWSPDGRSIYFYAVSGGTSRIERMRPDGSGREGLTRDATDDWAVSPAVSRQGRVAFASRHDGRWSIVSIAADGGDRRLESDAERDYWAPAWDPRTGRIVAHGPGPLDAPPAPAEVPGPFLVPGTIEVPLPDRDLALAAVRGYFPAIGPCAGDLAWSGLFRQITLSRLDGKAARDIFRLPGTGAWRPAWGPDGSWLVAVGGPPFAPPGAEADIWRFGRDGGGAVDLTPGTAGNDAFPDVSPDGRRIVFRSGRDGNHEIYLMNADGTGVKRLTHDPAADTMPSFSPRGDQIAFASNRDGNYEIYLLDLDADGNPGRLRRMTNFPGHDTHPRFSPDGAWIAFVSERGGLDDETPLIPVFNAQPYGEIFALRIADGLVVRLTQNKWEDGLPDWGTFESGVPRRGPPPRSGGGAAERGCASSS